MELLGDDVVLWGMLLAFGALVVLTFRVGTELFGTGAGVVAALVVLTRPAMLRDALLGYQDVVFAALILIAVLLEHRQPRRGVAVLVVLAIAGLLRPEAWILSGLYWLYLGPGVRTAVIVASAPILWALMDLAVTGDPLHSLHGTADLAELNDRRRDVIDAPYWTAKYYGFALREPLILAVPVGLGVAWVRREELGRRALIVLATVAALTAVFMAGPVFGLPLVARYVRTPSVLLALFAGLALFGWLRLQGRERMVFRSLAILTAVGFAVFAPANARMLGDVEQRFDRDARVFSDLRAATRDPVVRALCRPLAITDHRLLAHTRYWLDADPGSVVPTDLPGAAAPVSLLAPERSVRTERFFVGDFPDVPEPPGPVVYENPTFTVTTDCGR